MLAKYSQVFPLMWSMEWDQRKDDLLQGHCWCSYYEEGWIQCRKASPPCCIMIPHSSSTFQIGNLEMKSLESSLQNMKIGTCRHWFGFHFNLHALGWSKAEEFRAWFAPWFFLPTSTPKSMEDLNSLVSSSKDNLIPFNLLVNFLLRTCQNDLDASRLAMNHKKIDEPTFWVPLEGYVPSHHSESC